MYVRARLVEGVRNQALLAPQQGVTRNQRGEPIALVVNRENKAEQRKLTLDRAVGNRWIVTAGLRPGDRIIVEGLTNLQPGMTVQPGAPEQVTASPSGANRGQKPGA
jgi:membrane fusion protein (multidrug efflux system)